MAFQSFIDSAPLTVIVTLQPQAVLAELTGNFVVASSYSINEVVTLPYSEFFSQSLRGNNQDYLVFIYSADHLATLLALREHLAPTVILAPYELNIDVPSLNLNQTNFATLLAYEKESLALGSAELPQRMVRKARQLKKDYSKIILLCPDQAFLDQVHSLDDSLRTLIDKEAFLFAFREEADCLLDSCQTWLETDSTMGGRVKRLVYRSRRESKFLARLVSQKKTGLCFRFTTEKAFSAFPWEYALTGQDNYALMAEFPQYFKEGSLLSKKSFYPLPLSLKNNLLFSSWVAGKHPPFSLLGALTLIDNFSPSLFVYPQAVYPETNSYLAVVEQHYKTFYWRFRGQDGLETLAKIWEIMLAEIDTFPPSKDDLRVWAENNALSTNLLWSAVERVEESLAILQEKGLFPEKGPSSAQEVHKLALPYFKEIYSDRLMKKVGSSYEYQNLLYSVDRLSLPSRLQGKEILGLILSRDKVVLGLSEEHESS